MVYRVVGSTMWNQGSTGYLSSCQGYAQITVPH